MKCQPTAASEETIALIAEKFSEDPKDFNLHNGTWLAFIGAAVKSVCGLTRQR